ncbi:MAG: preprotein translocase subunit YajC [Lachnospiraceae bacterium]|nr:preprotein translocase subunit YajC [Lachnospiraceae bacterium]
MNLLLTGETVATDAAAAGGFGGSIWVTVIYIAVFIGIFYFMLIKPQQKEKKKFNAMMSSMEVGDIVVTTSGFYGVLIDITEEDVIVEFGNNKNCRIPMKKAAIAQIEKANADN